MGAAVTGMGVLCAIGNDTGQVLDALRNGRSSARTVW